MKKESAFTEEQKRIALLLLHEPKTAEQLNIQLNISFDKLQTLLKEMLTLKVIEKQGFPTKYVLKKEIADAVRKRKQIGESDSNRLKLKVNIEAEAIEENLLEKKLKEIESQLRQEKAFTVYSCDLEKTIKQGSHYISFLDITLTVKDFRGLMRLVFFYAPVSIEVMEPKKYEINIGDLQDGLLDASEMVNAYSQYIMGLLNKQELQEFNYKLFAPSRFRK